MQAGSKQSTTCIYLFAWSRNQTTNSTNKAKEREEKINTSERNGHEIPATMRQNQELVSRINWPYKYISIIRYSGNVILFYTFVKEFSSYSVVFFLSSSSFTSLFANYILCVLDIRQRGNDGDDADVHDII